MRGPDTKPIKPRDFLKKRKPKNCGHCRNWYRQRYRPNGGIYAGQLCCPMCAYPTHFKDSDARRSLTSSLFDVQLRVTRMGGGKREVELCNVSFRRYKTKREAFATFTSIREEIDRLESAMRTEYRVPDHVGENVVVKPHHKVRTRK
jgi:hypothetical protein